MQRLSLQDGREIHIRSALPADTEAIVGLYQKVYKGHYTLPEVADPVIIRGKVEDPNYFWTLAQLDERLIGSVIFAIDPVNKLGKCYAAVVLSEFRGQDVMRTMVQHGLERLTQRTRTCDVIYATTRTVSFAPQVVLEHLGFLPMGIFPNVRKVESFETHGLELYFRNGTKEIRRQRPQLVAEVVPFYEIARDVLTLEAPELVDIPLEDPRKMGEPMAFTLEEDADKVMQLFELYQDKDRMDRVFFPFHTPNNLFTSEDGQVEVFVTVNKLDGHGVILGYRLGDQNLRRALMWFCEAAAQSGIRYVEMLVSAFRPDVQRQALDAKFLPCAYFPAMRMAEDGLREDFISYSRSFETLDFMDMHLVSTNRRYLDAFMKCWYEMLIRSQPDFDEEWRIG